MRRRVTTIAVRPLRDAPDAGLSDPGTPESRLALVEALSLEAWTLAGHALPAYARSEAPVQVRPLRSASRVRERPASG